EQTASSLPSAFACGTLSQQPGFLVGSRYLYLWFCNLILVTRLHGFDSANPHVTARLNIRDKRSISCLTDAGLRFVLRFVTLCNLMLLKVSIAPGVISPNVLPAKARSNGRTRN